MVGTPDSGVDLRELQGDDCRAPGSYEVSEVWGLQFRTSIRCAGYLVFVGIAAVHDAGLAGENARSAGVLSHVAVDHRLRNLIFLGGAHDYVRLPLHGGP